MRETMGSKIRRMIDRASELLELAVNIIIIIAVIAVLTWFIPAGHYSVDDAGNIVA